MHFSSQCQFKDHKCRDCGKIGHREGYCACFTAKNRQKSSTFNIKKQQHSCKSVFVGNLDSGSDITIISRENWKKVGCPATNPADCVAKTASGGKLNISDMFSATISIGGIVKTCKIYMCGTNLNLNVLGSDAMDKFGLWDVPLSSICSLVHSSDFDDDVADLKARFPNVFSNTMGLCKKTQVHLTLKPDTQLVFKPKRPVAYSVEALVKEELRRLEGLGIITPITYADWAAPIVVVRRPNRSVRICADFSTGLNNALKPNSHPLQLSEDIFARMANCTIFGHIDLSDAYLQVEVDDESRKLLVINTHKGLYRFNRLSPGIRTAPGEFQQIMDAILSGIEYACPYLDDILVGGRTRAELKLNLQQVLGRLQEYGFTVRIEKCSFFMSQVKYLGQLMDREGIRPDPEKIAAIISMPAPHDVPTLRSYLGAVNYYGKYIREMRNLRQPLDELLKKGTSFSWSDKCQRSFDRFKEVLQSSLLLTHYNPRLNIVVSADASNVGIGARIAHRFPDGSEKAIYHASRSLTPAESKYSQIEKEALALIFAVTKFHRKVYGRHYVLQTDHKPLLAIFGSKQGIPAYTANRLQRWALTMLLYDFSIEYTATDHFGHADILSRLINSHIKPDEEYVIASIELESIICSIVSEFVGFLPVTYRMIAEETAKDDTLQKVKTYIKNGWPQSKSEIVGSPEIQQFFSRRDALSLAQKCLLYAERIVIPKKLQKRVLEQLHKGHPGVERTRSLARNFVYWPNIDDHINEMVRSCNECAMVAKSDTKTSLESWPIPEKPWQRVHIDYAGPVNDMYFLVLVDALSKWPEVVATKRITTSATLAILRSIFARFGMPEVMVSDNGTQFTSDQLERFCEVNGIIHLKTAPYHPRSNGQAERFVDTFKRAVKKIQAGGEELQEAIDTFLLCYRSTPRRSAPDSKSPGEVILGRRLRTSLELIRPPSSFSKCPDSIQDQQYNLKHGAKPKSFDVKDKVFAKVYQGTNWSWVAGEIVERIGAVIYNVWIPERQQLLRSHNNQLRKRHGNSLSNDTVSDTSVPLDLSLNACGINSLEDQVELTLEDVPLNEIQRELLQEVFANGADVPTAINREVSEERRSTRTRKLPGRYRPYHLY
ncbi:uncharacterized protein K02A2.6-like [Wyeomyia smithii]|uniref:uncharacterized protein K02A2.6-like n=1 Tax=Wyeomyia smithii TaxID=174621 RepID=UPI0024680768|nr:uncharacterized protein K02A2.6-like [Wyeomyia smithii]